MKLISVVYLAVCFTFAFTANAQTIRSLRTNFEAQAVKSYHLYKGKIDVFDTEACKLAISRMGSCYGANPAAPYILPQFKAVKSNGFNEYVDPIYGDLLNEQLDPSGYLLVNRMHQGEVKVLIAKMPPRAAYFGYQTYIFSRFGQGADDPIDQFLPSTQILDGHPERFYVFNSISNAVNNVVISNSIGGDGHWSNGKFAIITSHDENGIASVKSALKKAGFSDKQIFVERLGTLLKPGFGKKADEFISLIRYALPEDSSGSKFQTTPKNLFAYRLLPKANKTVVRASNETLDSRTGKDESQLKIYRNSVLNKIESKVLANEQTVRILAVDDVGIDSFECVKNSRNCLGDTRDTGSYQISKQFELKSSEAIVLVGVNHTKTGNAVYLSLALYEGDEQRPVYMRDTTQKIDVTSISQVGANANFQTIKPVLNGSAQFVLDQLKISYSNSLKNILPKLWAIIVARDCSGLPKCFEVKDSGDLSAPIDEDFGFIYRAYLEPGKARGVDPDFLLSPVMSHGIKSN